MSTEQIGGRPVQVSTFAEFMLADQRRVTSFVSNFGNWMLPAEVAGLLGVAEGHLEWVHETGELVLLGAVPHVGAAEAEVSRAQATEEVLDSVIPGIGGMPTWTSGVGPNGDVRVLFEADVVPPGTRVAVLGVVAHGPAVHELLWGWHRHHRHDDGWDWLVERLGGMGQPAGR